ncbi:MAG: MATE family efflux transporter [Fimbriimonadales bacterium]
MAEVLDVEAPRVPESSARVVWHLAWPIIALNSLQVVNSLLDAKFVSALGPASLNASGASQSFVFLIVSLAFALGIGATALVSRFHGAEQREDLLKASRQSVSLSLVIGICLSGIAAALIPQISALFVDRDSPAYGEMLRYLYPLMAGIPALYVFNALASCLRAVGDTKTPMYVSGVQILIHIVLNYILIFPSRELHFLGTTMALPGADLGIAGAGWAFSISAWVSAFLYFPASGRTVLGSTWRLQVIEGQWAKRILNISLPASLMTIIRVTSFAVFSMALKHTAEGEAALGAMRVGISMEAIAFMPAFGYMVAASALVGQSLGMKKPDRAESLAWSATNQAVLLISVMSVIFLVFAPQFSAIFVDDPAQRAIAIDYLRIVAITEPLFGYAMVLTGAHQGAGDTGSPTWANFISSWLIRVPAVWFFAVHMGFGSTAAWIAMSVSQAINGLMMIRLFKAGRWKDKAV